MESSRAYRLPQRDPNKETEELARVVAILRKRKVNPIELFGDEEKVEKVLVEEGDNEEHAKFLVKLLKDDLLRRMKA